MLLKCEREIYRAGEERIGDQVVPLERLAEEKIRDDREYHQGDAFLHDLQLHQGKRLRADPIRRDLEDIFKECHRPANQDHPHERLVSVLEMAIPRDGHENIRHEK